MLEIFTIVALTILLIVFIILFVVKNSAYEDALKTSNQLETSLNNYLNQEAAFRDELAKLVCPGVENKNWDSLLRHLARLLTPAAPQTSPNPKNEVEAAKQGCAFRGCVRCALDRIAEKYLLKELEQNVEAK